MRIGGGRRAKEDAIDPRVGMMVQRCIGDRVARGEVLGELHLAVTDSAAVAEAAASFTIGNGEVPAPPLVIERIG